MGIYCIFIDKLINELILKNCLFCFHEISWAPPSWLKQIQNEADLVLSKNHFFYKFTHQPVNIQLLIVFIHIFDSTNVCIPTAYSLLNSFKTYDVHFVVFLFKVIFVCYESMFQIRLQKSFLQVIINFRKSKTKYFSYEKALL